MNINDNLIYKSIESFISRFEGIVNFFNENDIQPEFSDKINTACVTFNSKYTVKCTSFLINETFWNKLNYNEKVLVFIHEVLHILFKHNKRVHEYFDSVHPAKTSYDIIGIATDICINHIIIEKYLNNIPLIALPTLKNMACLIETVFKPEDAPLIPKHMSFIYYYEKYIELYGFKESEIENFDDHISPEQDKKEENNKSDETQGNIDAILKDLLNDLGIEAVDDAIVSKGMKTFCINSTVEDGINEEVINKAKSLTDHFKLVINSIASSKNKENASYNWYGYNRRTSMAMQSINPQLNIPVSANKNKKEEDHRICIYLDVSGSCESYSTKFMELTANLPENYILDIHVFADKVKKVDVTFVNGKKVFNYNNAGYGTDINKVLIAHNELVKNKKYDAVFVLTDGEYSSIESNKQFDYSKWFFFMTPDYRKNIPERAKLFELKNL